MLTFARALHSRAGLIARITAASISLAPLVAHGQAGEPAFSSSFPRLFYNDTGALDGDIRVSSRFDVFTSAFWNQEDEPAMKLDSLRILNPNIQRLAYVNPAGRSFPEIADPNHVANRLAASIQDAWYVRNEMGDLVYFDPNIPNMPMLNLSNQCPRVNGRTWGEFLADFVFSEMMSVGLWEGIFFDNIWGSVSWVNAAIPGSIDLNGDGSADLPDSADVWWLAGLDHMLARFRSQAGPEVLVLANGNTRLHTNLNGRYFEDFPFREGWAGSMQQTADWQLLGFEPTLVAMVTRGSDTNFRLMRYGVCSALIAGVFSYHDHHDGVGQSWPNLTFYDEYQVDLGQPTGPPVELGIDVVAETDFETGVPPAYSTSCGSGQGVWTTDPALVIEGNASLLGRPGGDPEVWQLFLCTNPTDIPLTPGATYTINFRYRVVTEPPGDGFFFVNARSDVDIAGSDRNAVILDPPAGTVGQARAEVTLGNYPGYYILWGLRLGGQIVIDSIQIVSGRGGCFRRDFERGIALINPTTAPVTIDVEPGFHRIDGVIDPTTNNGAAATQVTLAREDGLVLLAGAAPPEGETPPPSPPPAPPAYFAFPNPASMSSTPAVQIAGVPAGGSVAVVTPHGRVMRTLVKPDADGVWRWDLRTGYARPAAGGVYLAMIRDSAEEVVGTVRVALRQ
jgi:hypothetical protein